MYYRIEKDYICHHGVKGQRWGVRRKNKINKKQKVKKPKKHRFLKALIATGLSIGAIYGTHRLLTTTSGGRKLINSGKKAVADVFNFIVLNENAKNIAPQPDVNPAVMEKLMNH